MFYRFVFSILWIVVCITISPKETFATHSAGAQLTVEHVSGNTYNVIYTFYRDCAGVSAPSNVTIDVSSVNCGVNTTLTLSNTSNTEITHACASAVSTCNGGTVTGIQKYIYEATIVLDSACTDWVFSHDLCCRNHSITTLNDPGAENIYIETHFNTLDVTGNSTPQFNNDPIVFTCLNQSFTYNNGVIDIDGDSLVFSLSDPMHLAGTPVVYNAGYSAANPLTTSTGFNINSQTGEITFTPSAIGIGVIVVRVDEYRNGVLISSVFRDMQIYVDACTGNALPNLSGFNNTTNFNFTIPANQPACLTIHAQDPDSANILTMSWNNGIPAATFTQNGANPPVGQICWTPTFADTLQNPHVFTVLVLDDNCPLNGAQVFTYTVNVVFDTTMACTITPTAPLCAGDTNGVLLVNAFQGVAPYNYLWGNGTTDSTLVNLSAGTYSVLVTDSLNDSASCSVTLIDPLLINLNLISANPTCLNLQDGFVEAQVSGGTAPYSYLWSNGIIDSINPNLMYGTYTLTVSDANSCSVTGSAILNNPGVITCTTTNTNIACFGLNIGTATVTASGGSGSYSYLWSSGQSTAAIQNLGAGIYTVTVSDGNSCTSTCSVQIFENPQLVATITSTNVICSGANTGTANIVVSGGAGSLTYLWSTGDTSTQVNGLSAGTYTVTVWDYHNCYLISQVSITEPAPLNLALVVNNVSCNGMNDGNASVQITGGTTPYNSNWFLGTSIIQPIDLFPGSYSLQVIDTNGCTANMPFAISQPNALSINSISEDITCYGLNDGIAMVNSSGGTLPISYNWSNGSSNQNLNALSPGTYVCTVMDANNCSVSSSVQIFEPTLLSGTVTSTHALCDATATGTASASVWGGIGTYNYNWSNGNTNASMTNLSAGVYTLTVNDTNNCTFTAQVNINEPTSLVSTITATNVLCNGDTTGSASAAIAGGTAPYISSWFIGVNPVNPLQLLAGNYHMQVTDVNGCTLSSNFVIAEPPALQVAANITDVLCNGDASGLIQALVSGGVTPYNYLWSNGNSTVSIQSLIADTYSLTITDSNNCEISGSYTINEAPLLVAEIVSDSILCINQSVSLQTYASGGSGINYQFYLNGTSFTGSGPFSFPASSDTCIELYVVDSYGCVSEQDTACVLVNPELNVLANAIDTVCFGDTITLSSQASGGNGGPYYYSWGYLGNGQTIQTVPTSYPYYSNYIVSVTDSCSPMAFDTVVVGFYNMPQQIITLENTQGCIPLDLQVTNNSVNSTYCAWSMGNGDSLFNCNSFSYTYNTPGTYIVSVELENMNGCKSSVDSVVTIEAYPLPIADFKFAPLEVELPNAEIDFYNNSTDAISFEWHFGDGSISYEEHPTHMYADSGSYTVTLIVENSFGCLDSHQLTVIVHMNLIVYMPNTFSPNYDGTNDNFYPKGVGIADEGYLLSIYNRWGDKIYETTQTNGYWDGTIKHSKNVAPQGVYLYLLTVSDYKKQPHYLTGTVTLIR